MALGTLEAVAETAATARSDYRLLYQPTWSEDVWRPVWTDRQMKMAPHRAAFRRGLKQFMSQLEPADPRTKAVAENDGEEK